ncbi:MAG: glycoside hydrolase family 5 protein [Myxococcales bacterium]
MPNTRCTGWAAAILVTVIGCSGDSKGGGSCKSGAEGCTCYGDSTCDAGLSCLSSLCVRASGGVGPGQGGAGTITAQQAGTGGDGASSGGTGGVGTNANSGSNGSSRGGVSSGGVAAGPSLGGSVGGTRTETSSGGSVGGSTAAKSCVAQCLSRQCGSLLDSCGAQASCGTCSAAHGCSGEGRCVVPGTVDDFGSCDRHIYDFEGRTGSWYFYRGTGVGCDVGACEGVSAPPWGSSCAAWIAGGQSSLSDVYAGMGFSFNKTSSYYDACAYTSIDVAYASDQAVRMYVKYDGTSDIAPRSYVTLPATTGVATKSIPLASLAIECSTVTELQFEPTSIASGFGIAVYSVHLRNATSPACVDGAQRCAASGALEVCSSSTWTPSSGPAEQHCVSDRCVANTATPVAIHGHLSVSGTSLIDQHGSPTQLRGVSSQWLNFEKDGYATNLDALIWMRDHWNLSLIRAAMGVEGDGAYLDSAAGRASMQTQVETIINNAAKAGVYVIVDWHSHDAHNQQAEAVAFFADISSRYGHLPNVLFETYNEPLKVDWSSVLVPYHQAVLRAIRDNDPDGYPNLTILGTPNWDQDADVAAEAPLTGSNLMYAVHFYSCDHNVASGHLGRAQTALNLGLPIFVSEWGATKADGGTDQSDPCLSEADTWHDWMNDNKISWAAWKLDDCDDLTVPDTSCQLVLGAPVSGGWSSTQISLYGAYVARKLTE